MSELARNIRASFLEYGATAVTVILNVLVIRHLGPEEYGLYTYSLSVVGTLSAVLGLGCFDQVLLREGAKEQDFSSLVWAMFWQRAFGTLLVLPALFVYDLSLDRHSDGNLGLLLIAWTTGALFVRDAFRMPLIAAQEIGTAVIISLIVYALGWVARLIALWLDAPMPVFLIIITGEGIVGGVAYYLAWRRRLLVRVGIAVSLRKAFELSRRSWPLLVTAGSVTAFTRIDQILLFHLIDTRSTGLYGSMVWIMERTFFLSGLVMGSFFPYLSHTQARDPAWYERSLRVGYKVMGLSAVPVAFVCSLYSTEILAFCLGQDFSGGQLTFAVLIWSLPFIFWGALNQKHLLIQNLLKTDMVFATLSALLNIALNLTLIPRLGLTGAAIAFVAGHGLYFILQWFLPDLRKNSQSILCSLALPLAACSASALINSWLPIDGLMAPALFLAQYGIFVWLACLFPISEDYATIRRQILRASGLVPKAER
ncbi:MAG: flippase [Methylococcales bacterium]